MIPGSKHQGCGKRKKYAEKNVDFGLRPHQWVVIVVIVKTQQGPWESGDVRQRQGSRRTSAGRLDQTLVGTPYTQHPKARSFSVVAATPTPHGQSAAEAPPGTSLVI